MGLIGGGEVCFRQFMGCGIGLEGKGSELGSFRGTISGDFLLECAICVLWWVNNNNNNKVVLDSRKKKKEKLEGEKDERDLNLILTVSFPVSIDTLIFN